MSRIAVIVGAVVGILAVALFVLLRPGDEQVPDAPVTAAVPQSADPVEQPSAAPAPPAAEPVPPAFDIVRVERSGETVMAGRSTPGAEVTVLDGDTVLGKVKANQSGEWVFLPEKPLAPGSHELGLRIAAPGAAAQPAAAGTAPRPAAADTSAADAAATDIAAGQETAAPAAEAPANRTIESEQVVVVVVPDTSAGTTDQAPAQPEQAIAVLTPRDGDGVSTILQQPDDGLADQDLVLNAVDYDDTGKVIISGLATAGALIIVYLDNRVIGRVVANGDGAWLLRPDAPVTSGLHSLRVDRVDATGKVIARVETPFSRSTVLAALDKEKFFVVQPGNSLWRIARRSYGAGMRYTVIYQANKSQIRDPDLIYPGQIFVVPPTD